jgi:hypothetical protein
MADEQTPVVETQAQGPTPSDGEDGGCCRAPGDPDGGPDT